MKTIEVTMVRVYMTESSKSLHEMLDYLKNTALIRGVSVFRAIQGFGETGQHGGGFIDLSLDLPIVLEFFDSKSKIKNVLEHCSELIKPEHIVFWDASANE